MLEYLVKLEWAKHKKDIEQYIVLMDMGKAIVRAAHEKVKLVEQQVAMEKAKAMAEAKAQPLKVLGLRRLLCRGDCNLLDSLQLRHRGMQGFSQIAFS